MGNLLEVRNLSVSFDTPQGEIQAVRDVSFALEEGEILAIVGESGCGKSVLCKSILKLLPDNAWIKNGQIFLKDTEITGFRESEMRRLRGCRFAMVLQDPLSALNPAMTIGAQIAEAVRVHTRLPKAVCRARVRELLALAGLQESDADCWPHHLSGGQRQRAVMAIALAGQPRVLFADEPTTALDVTIQAQILDLLRDIRRKLGTAVLLISHDLGVVARAADRVAVMYAGKIVETGTAEEIFYDPRHPYTWGLLQSLPANAPEDGPLYAIPGTPPSLIDPPPGDAFACRNPYALGIDYKKEPPLFHVSPTHAAATWLLDPRAPAIAPPFRHG